MSKSTLDKSLLDIISDPDGKRLTDPLGSGSVFTGSPAHALFSRRNRRGQNETLPHLLHHCPAASIRGNDL